MISIASGFQYSVNIGYDINQDEKLQNFIPTKSSLELLQDIIESTEPTSTERARVLVGAYGKGKSHIVLTILSVLMGKNWNLFTKLKEKVKKSPELDRLIKIYYESNKKLLPVIINGSSTSMQQSFLLALQKTLSENELLGVMPDTNYQAAINTIKKWQEDFPETFKKFKKEINQPVSSFIDKLESYDIETYGDFERLYPQLTSGSIFNPFLGFDIAELYESVVKSIKPIGYAGIFVVYDEFSKFLEANIKQASVSDTKMLQDFAEKCNRSGNNQLHLMLISHKEISNYIDKLPKQKVDGWRGVSERFKHIHLNNNFTQTYEIISSVIIKDDLKWIYFKEKHEKSFESLIRRYIKHAIFSDMSEAESNRTIYDCYPLHPVTTFILPRLSERVAQNERTLFTFLSAKGTATLQSFLDKKKDDFKLITPDLIFDYFEPLFRKESFSSELHRNYILTKTILDKLEDNSLQSKIIKTLSLIYILEQFDKIKPTSNELVGIYSLDYSPEEIRNAIDILINKEYVIYLRISNEYLRLKQTSGVDVNQEILDTIERYSGDFSVKDTLNSSCFDNYMYPSKYNDEREMTRFFSFEFINSEEISKDINWELKSESSDADGIIYGIIPQSAESLSKIKKLICSTCKGKDKYIFILPKKYTEIRDVVLQFNAVMKLKNEATGDDILFDEYEVIYEDLREVIADFINSYTHPENFKSIYIHDGLEQTITRKASLTGLMSKICDKIYSRTPVINNEAINKKELTGTAFTSRNKIIAGLLRNTLEENLGLTGSGQEVSIMRSTLIRKNILITEDGGLTRINLSTGEKDVDYMLSVIVDFIHEAKRKGNCEFSKLYEKLTSSMLGIGLRKALIPIYLAAVLHEYNKESVIIGNLGQNPLNIDTLLQIEANPSLFSLQYLDWDPDKELFIREIEETFKDYIIDAEKTVNSYEYVVSAMKRWYMALPKYSKEKIPETRAKRYKGLIRLIKQNIGSYDLLFVKLPQEFGQEALADYIKAAKKYYDNVLNEFVQKLIEDVKEIFIKKTTNGLIQKRSSLTSVIKDWCDKLNPNVFEQLFENGADRFLGYLKEVTNDEKTFIIRLAKLITDLRIEDWEESTYNFFIDKLNEYKITAENYCGEDSYSINNTPNTYSLTYVDENGKSITKRFDRVEQSKRGILLMNSLLADLESMGYSISEQEKRQILMEVLRKLC